MYMYLDALAERGVMLSLPEFGFGAKKAGGAELPPPPPPAAAPIALPPIVTEGPCFCCTAG